MPHHYESLATYTRRQAYLASQEAQAPPVVPQPEPSVGGKLLGGLTKGLTLLGKPVEYTAKAAEALLPGGPPAGEVRGFGDILRGRGVPGAGLLGLAADIALDPLNLLFLAPPLSPLALAAKARRGAQVALPAGRAMPEFAETAAKIGQPSVARKLAQGIEQVPLIGKPLVGRIAGPAATAKPGTMAHSLVTYERQAETVRFNVAPRYLNQVAQHRSPFILDKDQRITNISGVDPIAFADAFDDAAVVARMMPEQQAYIQVYRDAKRPLLQEAVRQGVPGLESEEVITSRLVIGHWEKLPGGRRRFRPILPEEGIQRARRYKTMEKGIAAGEVYADPVRTLEVKLVEMGDALNTKQLADYLKQIGLAVPKGEEVAAGLRGIPGSAAFAEMRFEEENARLLLRHFQDIPGGFTSNVNQIMGSIRSFRTTADASAMMIQGLPLLAISPKIWAKATFESLHSLADAQNRARYIAREANFLARHPDLYVSATEQFEAVRQGMPLARKALAIPILGPVLRVSQRIFDTFGDVARIEWAKAMEPLAKAAGRLDEIDEFANKVTGVTSRRALGIPASQRAMEGAYLLFAPRYTMAALALSGNLLQGGLRGDLARDAIARMLVVGSAFFVKSAKAAGLDDEEIERRLDPTSSSFMTLPVLGMNVGIGGVYMALAKLVSRVVEDPGQLRDISVRDPTNPLIRFWRGRTTPGTQYFWDVAVSGQDYLGNPIASPQEIASYFLRTTTPIAAGAIAETAIQEPRRALGALPELVGARTFPLTKADMRQQIARELFDQPYEALGSIERAQVDRDERMRALPEPPGRFYAESRERSKIFRDYEEEVNTAAEKVFMGHFTKRNFRDALGEIRNRRNILLSQLPKVEQRTPEGKAYVNYINMLKAEPGEDVDFDAAEVFKASLPQEQQGYIDQRLLASDERFANPQVRELLSELRADRETLRPYWEFWEQALERYGLLDRWQEASPAEREALRQERRYKRAQSFVSRHRKRLRRRDPEIDETLIDWGYASVPIREQRR